MRTSTQLSEAITRHGPHGFWSVKTPKEMGFKVPKASVPKMPSGRFALTPDVVRRLRKDFLTLMKNAKRAKTYSQLRAFSEGLAKWRMMMWRIREQVDSRLNIIEGEGEEYRNPSESAKAAARQAKVYRKNIIKSWGNLFSELQAVPIGAEWNARYREPTGQTREDVLAQWKAEGPKWEARVRRKARKVWDEFDEFLEWIRSKDEKWGAGGEPLVVSRPRKEQFQVEGFTVKTVGYSDRHSDDIKNFGVALGQYRKRAARFVPALLKRKLPFIVSFETDPVNPGVSGYYDVNRIQIGAAGIYKTDVPVLLHLIAHEMGHHLHFLLSDQKTKAWSDFVKGGTTSIDLREVLSRQREGEDDVAFLKRLQKEDPVLLMRIGTVRPTEWGIPSRELMGWIRGEANRKGVINVSTRLPSSYSAMSADEAFAEVIGNLVAYGPRTVPDETLAMLRILYPESKVESRGLASELEDALTERSV